MTSNDGGPAFPHDGPERIDGATGVRHRRAYMGMSLRDYFAGQALATIIPPTLSGYEAWDATSVAACAYQMADAMLRAREGGHD
jgi:hypothetical protein